MMCYECTKGLAWLSENATQNYSVCVGLDVSLQTCHRMNQAYVSGAWKFFGWKKERAREREKRVSLARNFQAPTTFKFLLRRLQMIFKFLLLKGLQ